MSIGNITCVSKFNKSVRIYLVVALFTENSDKVGIFCASFIRKAYLAFFIEFVQKPKKL